MEASSKPSKPQKKRKDNKSEAEKSSGKSSRGGNKKFKEKVNAELNQKNANKDKEPPPAPVPSLTANAEDRTLTPSQLMMASQVVELAWNKDTSENPVSSALSPGTANRASSGKTSKGDTTYSEVSSELRQGNPPQEIKKSLWQQCCDEVQSELLESESILKKMNLPSLNYSKEKSYPLTDYDSAPDIELCKTKDFLDFYIFPILLPAIQALIDFAKLNQVLQCRYSAFNPVDYITEYLYNNNPLYPERLQDPVPLFEVPFMKNWIEKFPRPPLPRWMTMTEDEAARLIQKLVRGFLVRSQPKIQKMNKFWKDFKDDIEQGKANKSEALKKRAKSLAQHRSSSSAELSGEWDNEGDSLRAKVLLPYYDELTGEWVNEGEGLSSYYAELAGEWDNEGEALRIKAKLQSPYYSELAGEWGDTGRALKPKEPKHKRKSCHHHRKKLKHLIAKAPAEILNRYYAELAGEWGNEGEAPAEILSRYYAEHVGEWDNEGEGMSSYYAELAGEWDNEEGESIKGKSPTTILSYAELAGEWDNEDEADDIFLTHSEVCIYCAGFKEFMEHQEEERSLMNPPSSAEDEDETIVGDEIDETLGATEEEPEETQETAPPTPPTTTTAADPQFSPQLGNESVSGERNSPPIVPPPNTSKTPNSGGTNKTGNNGKRRRGSQRSKNAPRAPKPSVIK